MLKEYSKRQETLDVSTAPSVKECKTKRVAAGVWAKEITCEASTCFHEFSPLRLRFCLSFYACVNVVKALGWETGLAAWRLSTSLAPLNFSSNTLAHVVPVVSPQGLAAYTSVQCSSRLISVLGAHVYDVPEGSQGRLFGCTRGLPERGVEGWAGQRRF